METATKEENGKKSYIKSRDAERYINFKRKVKLI